MLSIGINTCSPTEAVALFSNIKVLQEIQWKGEYNESEKLLPAIGKLLKKAKISFFDLQRIIVVAGPGPFSSLRIGVTVANILAFALKIPLFAIDTEKITKLKKNKSFGKTLLMVELPMLEKKKIVTPRYLYPPNITVQKNNYVP